MQVVAQIPFVENNHNDDDDNDKKINKLFVLFVKILHYKYTILSNCYMKKRKFYWARDT